MRLRTVGSVLLALAGSGLIFGAQPAKVGIVSKSETPVNVTRAVQFGKGTGITRNQETLSGNAYRSVTAADAGTVKKTPDTRPNYPDTGLRK